MPRTVPTRTLKWPRRNRVQITCNTHCSHHVQHVVCHLERRDSAATKVGRVEIAFTTALSFCLKRLSDGFMRNELKNRTCCHTYTETEVADQACFLTQPPYTDTGPTSPSTGRLRQTPGRAATRAPVPTKVPIPKPQFCLRRGKPGPLPASAAHDVVCWLVGQRPSNTLVYLRGGAVQTIVRAAALRQKLQVKLSISPSHIILTPG